MAYEDECDDENDWWDKFWNPCVRVAAFSTPDVLVDGEPLGSSTADNAATLQSTGSTMASLDDRYD